MFFINHLQKFEQVVKSMVYVKVNFCHLKRNVKGLKESSGTQCGHFLGKTLNKF